MAVEEYKDRQSQGSELGIRLRGAGDGTHRPTRRRATCRSRSSSPTPATGR